MIANLMMMGMNPMTGNQQQGPALQAFKRGVMMIGMNPMTGNQQQAFQRATMPFGQNMGHAQAGGDGLGGMFSPRMPMMGTMGTGMGMNTDLGPVSPMMVE